jgi:hypothetical protein
MSLFLEEELLVLIHNGEMGILDFVHFLHIQSNFSGDGLHMLIIEINTISESLNSTLESNKIKISESKACLGFINIIFF